MSGGALFSLLVRLSLCGKKKDDYYYGVVVQPLEVGWSEAPPPISDIGLQALNVEANKKIYISTAAPLWDRIFFKSQLSF